MYERNIRRKLWIDPIKMIQFVKEEQNNFSMKIYKIMCFSLQTRFKKKKKFFEIFRKMITFNTYVYFIYMCTNIFFINCNQYSYKTSKYIVCTFVYIVRSWWYFTLLRFDSKYKIIFYKYSHFVLSIYLTCIVWICKIYIFSSHCNFKTCLK